MSNDDNGPDVDHYDRGWDRACESRDEAERAERLAEAREFAQEIRTYYPNSSPKTAASAVLALDDEVTRLTGLLTAVRALASEDYEQSGRQVSCAGYLVTDEGCFAGSLARRILRALNPQED